MKIAVQDEPTTFVLNDLGLFHCSHDNAIIEKPCCNGQDCSCNGLFSVSCPDCDSKDLTQDDALYILTLTEGE